MTRVGPHWRRHLLNVADSSLSFTWKAAYTAISKLNFQQFAVKVYVRLHFIYLYHHQHNSQKIQLISVQIIQLLSIFYTILSSHVFFIPSNNLNKGLLLLVHSLGQLLHSHYVPHVKSIHNHYSVTNFFSKIYT